MLSDEFWSKLEKILLQEAIYNRRNLRMTVERNAVSSAGWLSVERAFGRWSSIGGFAFKSNPHCF
jgi:hypothetical protein